MITTKDMRNASDQEVFNHVYEHLLTQGVKAESVGGACRLRVLRNGQILACAVGCLIPEEHYNREMETSAFTSNYYLLTYFPKHQHKLLEELQKVHDYAPEPGFDWEPKLGDVARNFNLQIPKIDRA